jgi:putative nucleotidyltransferase with HDIG domain
MASENTHGMSPAVTQLIEGYERSMPEPLSRRERLVEGLFAVVAIGVAASMTMHHAERSLSLATVVLMLVAYAGAKRIRFAVGAGYTIPTQIVFVPMLLLLPTPMVPLLVIAGILLGNLPDYAARRVHLDRVLLAPGDALYAVPPALVLILGNAQTANWSDWPIYLAALGAQLALDPVLATLREWLALGVHPSLQPRLLAWVTAVDALLTPIGLMAALIGAEHSGGWLLGIPVLALIALFARERKARIEHALELGRAYRGTTLLLADVLEADDEYTGSHSHGVVALALKVADAMGLDSRQRRNVEFGALLHDVGKIAVPNEIINKPGPLTDDEWLVIKTHTIEGQSMLERVGGVLGDVGQIVRSSHERWDGGGYPDGLRGEEIPIESCIVACCDAFDAMTTDRSYRAALPPHTALAELRANVGTQFHPDVVEVLDALVVARLDTPASKPARLGLPLGRPVDAGSAA